MWHYKVDGRGRACRRGPVQAADGGVVSFALVPTQFIVTGHGGVARPLHRGAWCDRKEAGAGYAHVWTVKDGKITRFRQYIDTLAVAEARRS